jgi:hypothetical protein
VVLMVEMSEERVEDPVRLGACAEYTKHITVLLAMLLLICAQILSTYAPIRAVLAAYLSRAAVRKKESSRIFAGWVRLAFLPTAKRFKERGRFVWGSTVQF